MKLKIEKTDKIGGEVAVPSSKSHSIRALIISSLAKGGSKLTNVLESKDTEACINACKALGAKIEKKDDHYLVTGFDGNPSIPDEEINTLNSGTTTNLISSVVALGDKKAVITGDESIQKRPMQPLLSALNNLGASVMSVYNNGCPPIEIEGPLTGGKTELNCKSSQYLSSLLISCPLVADDTFIEMQNVCEKPYIDMTFEWLDDMGVKYERDEFNSVKIAGGQKYNAFEKIIPGDWSSASFLIAAGAMLGKEVVVKGLDIENMQADREVVEHLKKMGANIVVEKDKIKVNRSLLKGAELDLNNTPDALPVMAALACFAKGRTVISNVAHARIKETDRIKVMTKELSKMGAEIEEFDDGMTIECEKLVGAKVEGYDDHRVVMALSLAGMVAEGKTEVSTAEAVDVTFPDYVDIMKKLGAKFEAVE